MKLQELLNNRYTVKQFDTEKKISAEDMEALQELLIMSPSSVNIQPWNFIIATSDKSKALIAKSTENFGFNTQKLLDAAAIIVFSTNTNMSEEYFNTLVDKEDQDGRFPKAEYKDDMYNGRSFFYNFHKDTLNDAEEWLEKQVYLNVGHFAMGASVLGIDSVIMEGFDRDQLAKDLDLVDKSLRPTVVVGVGYGAETDFNADLPKSRLGKSVTINQLD